MPRFLQVHPHFDENDTTQRCARLINAFGTEAEHAIVSGDPARREASGLLERKARVTWPKFPPLSGKPWPSRLKKLAEAMQGYDLVCTYGWGAIDAALAHTMFADVYKLAPLVHHEDAGDGRVFYRRIALGRATALVVPSRTLERTAIEEWQQPRSRVRRIAYGIPISEFGKKARPGLLPDLIKRRGELWAGTLGPLTPARNLPAMVRAFAGLPEEWQLIVAGDGPEREAILGEARDLGIEDRVHLAVAADSAKLTALLDMFVLSSSAEQFPVPLAQAMAAGLPVVAPAVGDVSAMVAAENLPFITPPGDAAALAESMRQLAGDAVQRAAAGKANKAKARAEFDEAKMIERFRSLYWSAMARRPG